MAEFADHLHVVGYTLVQPARFEFLADAFEIGFLLSQVVFYLVNSLQLGILGSQEEVRRIDFVVVERSDTCTAQRVDLLDGVHLVVPKRDTEHLVGISQIDFDRVALDTEFARLRRHVIAHVQTVDQAAQKSVAVQRAAALKLDDILIESAGIAHAIDARHGRHHNHVLSSRQEGRRGRQAQLVDFFIDGQVFLNVRIGRSDVCLRLIVVVIGNVILYCVLREETFELAIELRGQRLVMAQHEGRLVHLGHNVSDGERLARPGDAEQRLCGFAGQHAVRQLPDGIGLVARGSIIGNQFEFVHADKVSTTPAKRKGRAVFFLGSRDRFHSQPDRNSCQPDSFFGMPTHLYYL